MPHDIRSAWFKTLGQLALILALAVVVGLLVGQVWPIVTVAALGVEKVWANPDCGLKTRGYPETEAALRTTASRTREFAGIDPPKFGPVGEFAVKNKGLDEDRVIREFFWRRRIDAESTATGS